MKKIIISILLIASLPLIGSTDNPKKQLPWQEKGKILRKHIYKYAIPTLIITEGLLGAIKSKQYDQQRPNQSARFNIKKGIDGSIENTIKAFLLYPILPYTGPVTLIFGEFLTVYLVTSVAVLKTIKDEYNENNEPNPTALALDIGSISYTAYVFHKVFKEIKEKTDALNTRNQPDA